MSKDSKITSDSCLYSIEISCITSTGGQISSTAKSSCMNTCRVTPRVPQERAARLYKAPNPLSLAISPDRVESGNHTMSMLCTKGSQADPLMSTAGLSFLVAWRTHQQWLMDWNCYSGWAKPIKGHFEYWAAFPSLLSSTKDMSRLWAKRNCSSPSTWKSLDWFSKLLKQRKRSVLRCQMLKNISEQEHSLSPSSLACPLTASGFNISPSLPPMAWVADHVLSKPRKGQLQIFVQSWAVSPSPVRNDMTLIW